MDFRLRLARSFPSERRSDRWQRAGLAIAIFGVLLAGAAFFTDERILAATALAMAAWCAALGWSRAGWARGAHRGGWGCVVAGSAAAALSVGWRIVDPAAEAGNAVPPMQTGLLATMAMFLVGIVLLRPPRRDEARALPLVLDLVIALSTLACVLWALVADPVLTADGRLTTDDLVALGHAGVDGLLLLTLLVVGLRLPPGGGYSDAALLARGMAVLALADIAATVLWVNAGVTDAWAALYAAAFTLFAIFLGRERRRLESGWWPAAESALTPDAVWRLWLAAAPFVLLSVLIGRSALSERYDPLEPVVTVAGLAVVALELARQGLAIREAHQLTAYLNDRAGRDPLTGLINHRTLHERLERELAGARLSGYPIAVALIDVDRFKQINDELGHVVGDHVLTAIAATLSRACRSSDVAARYAGDEFALILPGLDTASAAAVGERIIAEVARLSYWPGPNAEQAVSISAGFAVTRGGGPTGRQLIAAADSALYSAKRAGRNRYAVVDADEREHDPDPHLDPRRLITAHPAV